MKLIQCNVCGNPGYRVLYMTKDRSFPVDGFFQWVRCPRCGLFYLNPQPEIGELQRHYPADDYYAYRDGRELEDIVADGKVATLRTVRYATMKQLGRISPFFQNENERETSYFGPIRPGMRILDVGCGAGQGLTFYKEHGAATYGVEISSEACEEGKRRGHYMFCGQLVDAGFENGFFDIAFFKQSLEHMFSPEKSLAETHRVLKSEGKVWISLPNHGSTHAKLFGKWFYGIESPRHLFGFSPETLTRLLQQTGFEIETLHTYYLPGGVCYSVENWLNDHFDRAQPFFYSKIKIKWWYIAAEPMFLFPRMIADLLNKGEMLTICARKV